MRHPTVSKPQLRSFGLIVGAGFAVVALWRTIFHSEPPRMWALTVSSVLVVTALIAPAILRPFHRIWMRIGEALGWLNSRIILSIVFYLVIVPIGLVRRLTGTDPMRRRFDPTVKTYKVSRSPRAASHMHHQY
jgi:hypothetical protein